MNVELMSRVLQRVKSQPKSFAMDKFFSNIEGEDEEIRNVFANLDQWLHSCGTAACIAGWTMLLEHDKVQELWDDASDYHVPELLVTANLLDVSYDDITTLCLPWYWSRDARDVFDPDQQLSDEQTAILIMERAIAEKSLDFWTRLNESVIDE